MSDERTHDALTPYPGARLLQGSGDHRIASRTGDQLTVAHDPATAHLLTALYAAADEGAPLDFSGIPEDARAAVDELYLRLRGARAVAPRDEARALLATNEVVRALWVRGGEAEPVAEIEERIQTSRVLVLGDGEMAEAIAADLVAAGCLAHVASDVDALADGPAPSLSIVVAPSDEAPLVAAWNLAANDRRLVWLLVTPFDGVRASVGPLVIPGASACAECLRLRRAANFPAREISARVTESVAAIASGPPVSHTGLELVQRGIVHDIALCRVGLAANSPAGRPGILTTVEPTPSGPRLTDHRVLRVPRCPVCTVASGTTRPQVWAHGKQPADGLPA